MRSSTGVSALCDRDTPVHTTCLHSSGNSWGAGIVPGVFGTFCSGTLPSWVALMTQQFRSDSLSFPASRHLSQQQAGPTSSLQSSLLSGGALGQLPLGCYPCVPSGIRLGAGNLHPDKALVDSRCDSPGGYFPMSGCGLGDCLILSNPPER